MDEDPTGDTVGAVARRAGITVRTLHHWDAIGLVGPSARTPGGYRIYDDADQDRVQRVVAHQRAGLGLDAIRELLDQPGDRIVPALAEQRRLLAERIDELQALDGHLERMEQAHERGVLLGGDEQAEVFGDGWNPAHTEQARQQWGSTLQWAQFAERSAGRDRADWEAVASQMTELEERFGAAMDDGVPPDDERAAALVDRHREVFGNYFPITRSMQVCLGRLFANDPGFAAHHDGIRPGLASWLHRAIDHAAAAHGIDPDTATWE